MIMSHLYMWNVININSTMNMQTCNSYEYHYYRYSCGMIMNNSNYE